MTMIPNSDGCKHGEYGVERAWRKIRLASGNEMLCMDFCLDRYAEKSDDQRFKNRKFGDSLLRMVGGCVRDMVLGVDPKDIDFCTPFRPEQLIEAFKGLDRAYEIIPTGLQHGTITLRFPNTGNQYEITTLRADVATDGRHAEVEFVTDFRQDAERRDFTMNAMSIDGEGNLFDYFGGLEDARAGRVRFVGNPQKRIEEDYLRILRFYRFSARMGTLALDQETARAINRNMHQLAMISGERIWAELSKILMTSNAEHILFHMGTPSFFRYALGLSRQNTDDVRHDALMMPEEDELESARIAGVPPAGLLYAWLWWCTDAFHDRAFHQNYERITTALTRRLAWSREEADLFRALSKYAEQDYSGQLPLFQAVLNKDIRLEHAQVYEKLHGPGRGKSVLEETVPEFPVTGQDFVDLGFQPGPAIGKIMKDLRLKWALSDGTLDGEDLLAMAMNPTKED